MKAFEETGSTGNIRTDDKFGTSFRLIYLRSHSYEVCSTFATSLKGFYDQHMDLIYGDGKTINNKHWITQFIRTILSIVYLINKIIVTDSKKASYLGHSV